VHFAEWLVYPNTEPGCSPPCPPPGPVRPRARILRPVAVVFGTDRGMLKMPFESSRRSLAVLIASSCPRN
jgi:hypothetical protein